MTTTGKQDGKEKRRPIGPEEDCKDVLQALVYARQVLYRSHVFIGLTLGATLEAKECEYAIQCLDRAMHELLPNAVTKPGKYKSDVK